MDCVCSGWKGGMDECNFLRENGRLERMCVQAREKGLERDL